MRPRSRTVTVAVPLSAADYQPFVFAIRRLHRIMGAQAPDVITLIRTNLQERDARGLAEDYLDAVGWPQAERRVKYRSGGGPRRRGPVHLQRANELATQLPAPADPTRN